MIENGGGGHKVRLFSMGSPVVFGRAMGRLSLGKRGHRGRGCLWLVPERGTNGEVFLITTPTSGGR